MVENSYQKGIPFSPLPSPPQTMESWGGWEECILTISTILTWFHNLSRETKGAGKNTFKDKTVFLPFSSAI
jgi:hypothetical protein